MECKLRQGKNYVERTVCSWSGDFGREPIKCVIRERDEFSLKVGRTIITVCPSANERVRALTTNKHMYFHKKYVLFQCSISNVLEVETFCFFTNLHILTIIVSSIKAPCQCQLGRSVAHSLNNIISVRIGHISFLRNAMQRYTTQLNSHQ